jgi:hypothetical protein
MNTRIILLLIIFLFGAFARLFANNWDDGQHLHPDERFLTMVVNDMERPTSLPEYFDPSKSRFNPDNLKFDFFVYGVFPLVFVKLLASVLQMDNYLDIVLLGRYVSAICDILTLFLVYRISLVLQKKHHMTEWTSVFATFFYASFVLPIQLSHFYTVDMFLQFFLFGSFYFALLYYERRRVFYLIFSGIFWGLALSSKVSAIYFLPLLFSFFALAIFGHRISEKVDSDTIRELLKSFRYRFFKKLVLFCFLSLAFFFIAYCIVRVADPYLFESSWFFNIRPSSDFITDLTTLKSFDDPEGWFPPAVQWIGKPPVIFSLYNLAFFGVGIFSFCAVLFGIVFLVKKYRYVELVIILLWVVFFFLYQSSQFSKTMRYFILIYPFLAIFAGIFLSSVLVRFHKSVTVLLGVICLLWPVAFYSIYLRPHTRVAASHFIYNTIPQDEILLTEHWDDPLPLPVENPLRKTYTIEQLPVFDPDTDEKWSKMDGLLEKGDYLILSSNRGWGSMPSVPHRYPRMKEYYDMLLRDTHPQFRLVRKFTSYPGFSYLGIPLSIPDSWAEEAFTVYDHPEVMIFEKVR